MYRSRSLPPHLERRRSGYLWRRRWPRPTRAAGDAAIIRLVGTLMFETNDEWAFRGFRRATGATVPSTAPLHGAGVAGPHHRTSQRQAARFGLLARSGLSKGRPAYTRPWGTTSVGHAGRGAGIRRARRRLNSAR